MGRSAISDGDRFAVLLGLGVGANKPYEVRDCSFDIGSNPPKKFKMPVLSSLFGALILSLSFAAETFDLVELRCVGRGT